MQFLGELQGLEVIPAFSQLIGQFANTRFKRHRSLKSMARPGRPTPYSVPGSPVRLGFASFRLDYVFAATRDCTLGQANVAEPMKDPPRDDYRERRSRYWGLGRQWLRPKSPPGKWGVEKPDFSRHLDFHTTAGWLCHLLGHVKQQLAVRFFDSTQ
jgi:hypothetical protein